MRRSRNLTRIPRPIVLTGATVVAALMLGVGIAQADGHHAATVLTKVTVQTDRPSHHLVTIEASGSPLTYVDVCDLPTSTCVKATRESGVWVARVPAQAPLRLYAIGVVGRSASGYVTGYYASNPPAPVPPPPNIG